MVLHRNLGPFGTTAIGLGEMPLTIENNLGHDKGIETIHAALDAGCRHLDTAWAYYCSGRRRADRRKADPRGAWPLGTARRMRSPSPPRSVMCRNFTDGRQADLGRATARPENLIKRGKESALALGVDTIDLLYFHRHDPKVPYNESVEAIKQLVDEGVAQEAGISNASIEQIDIARGILGDKLVAVQNQYSPIHLDTAGHAGIHARRSVSTFVCWSPLGGYPPAHRTRPSSTRSARSRRLVASPTSRSCSRWELAKGDHVFVDPRRPPSRDHPRQPACRRFGAHPRRACEALRRQALKTRRYTGGIAVFLVYPRV